MIPPMKPTDGIVFVRLELEKLAYSALHHGKNVAPSELRYLGAILEAVNEELLEDEK